MHEIRFDNRDCIRGRDWGNGEHYILPSYQLTEYCAFFGSSVNSTSATGGIHPEISLVTVDAALRRHTDRYAVILLVYKIIIAICNTYYQ